MCLFAVLTGHLPYIGHKGTVGFLFCGPPVRTSFMEGGSQQFQKTAISQRCWLLIRKEFLYARPLLGQLQNQEDQFVQDGIGSQEGRIWSEGNSENAKEAGENGASYLH